MFASTLSRSLRASASTSPLVVVPRSAPLAIRSLSRSLPAFAPAPARTHSPKEEEIRLKLVDRLEATECDVEDSSGAVVRLASLQSARPH